MDEFEKIRAFSAELGKKTEEAVAAENETPVPAQSEVTENAPEMPSDSERADFLENWSAPSENAEETRRLSKTFWVVFGGVTLLVACLIMVICLLLKGPMENDEVVTISPTQKPTKVRPENPGGMVIPDQDKVIYSRISQDTIPAKVEKLFPEEEKPVMPEVVASEPAPEISVFDKTEENVEVIQAEPLQDELVVEEVKEEVKVPAKTEPKKIEKPKVVAKKGEWKIQLYSSVDKAKVEKEWQAISKKQKALVSDMPMQIVKADIAGKGTYYRLQVGAFETREMAANLCAKLKKQKQDCIPAK